jgi:hypothetical protein
MAKPTLRIELDPPNSNHGGQPTDFAMAESYLPEETIRGRVIIDVPEPITCRKIIVNVGWRTEGRGDLDYDSIHEQHVESGELNVGTSTYEFSCELPDGPISYAGHYINIIWEASARIDLAWKIDPKAAREFYLLPATELSSS